MRRYAILDTENRAGGTVRLDCTPAGTSDRPAWCFAVRDTGPGIIPENLGRLFTPFERLGAERNRQQIIGTGLGPALARQMVALMGGEIGVESVAGAGSTFWVEVPAAEGAAAPLVKSDRAAHYATAWHSLLCNRSRSPNAISRMTRCPPTH